MKAFLKSLVVVLILGGIATACVMWYLKRNAAAVITYKTAPIQRGELLATISATGTLEPEEVVDVGAQVAGRIVNFGPDPAKATKTIDYNTEVNEGDVLAEIDSVLYVADVDQAKAALASAEANVNKAEADARQAKAKALQAERDWTRARTSGKNVMSQADIDSFESAYESGKANVTSAEASVALAKAGVTSANATLNRVKLNLSYCTIKSPVKGVIIDRRVNVGQTVVSSLNAPSLFLIAKDLTKMQIWAAVNEADIGSIHPDQPVTFNVDKLPGREFHGVVGKVRMNAQTTQNVVTYTVEINVDNSDRALIPYLTTNVKFEVARHEGVLMVPNAVLRWAPTQATQVSEQTRAAMTAANVEKKPKSTTSPTTRRTDGMARRPGALWVKDGAFVKPIKVKIGLTDGSNTEVIGEELTEGMEVITGEARADDPAGADAKNPFMPQFGRPAGGGGGRRGG